MIAEFKKYKDIDAFVKNRPLTEKSQAFTILHKCKGLDYTKTPAEFTARCFACLFCVLQDRQLQDSFRDYWQEDVIHKIAASAFTGDMLQVPTAKMLLRNDYKSLEFFTARKETSNIQPWAAELLHHSCSKENRIGMEVPIFHPDYPRNGRLDICVTTEEKLLVAETKTNLDDALSDERFVEQQEKYTTIIRQSTAAYRYITLIGGRESDLFPTDSPCCTGVIGGKTQRFYDLITDNGIKFVSANALLALCCKYLEDGAAYAWDNFLYQLFSDPDCIGLLSAGKVMKRSGTYVIEAP